MCPTWRERLGKDEPKPEPKPDPKPDPSPAPPEPVPYDPPLIGPIIPPHRFPRNDAATRVLRPAAEEFRAWGGKRCGNGDRPCR